MAFLTLYNKKTRGTGVIRMTVLFCEEESRRYLRKQVAVIALPQVPSPQGPGTYDVRFTLLRLRKLALIRTRPTYLLRLEMPMIR